MNYTFHQLKIFMAVVEHKSVTKAAVFLGMTQPAVSIQLKNLQEQFDIPLTEVIKRKIYVTDFGQELYQISEKILQEVEAINFKTLSFKNLTFGKLKLSVASTGKYVMPYYLKGFLKANPSINLQMDVTNKTRVLESLENNEVDFALISALPDKLELEQEILIINNLYLTCAADNDLDGDTPLNENTLAGQPLIYREEGSATRLAMQQYFNQAHILPKVRIELTSSEAVKQAVIAGLGLSIQSVLSIKNELRQQEIKIVPVKGLPLQEHWRLVWLKSKKMSKVGAAFLEYIQQNKQQVYHEHFSWMEEVG